MKKLIATIALITISFLTASNLVIAKESYSLDSIKYMEENYKRIELIVLDNNKTAKKLYNQLGFKVDGVLDEFFKCDDGTYVKGVLMSLLLF